MPQERRSGRKLAALHAENPLRQLNYWKQKIDGWLAVWDEFRNWVLHVA